MTVNMLVTVILSALLLGGLGGSDLQVFGKSVHSGKILLSNNDGTHSVRKQPHQEVRNFELNCFHILNDKPLSKNDVIQRSIGKHKAATNSCFYCVSYKWKKIGGNVKEILKNPIGPHVKEQRFRIQNNSNGV